VVPIPTLEFDVSRSKKLLTLNALVDEVRVKLAEPDVAVSERAPVVRVSPFEPVSVPAEVMVPEPVVEILFAVDMAPNPVPIEPDANVPTVVNEEVVTPEPNVFPESTSVPAILKVFPVARLSVPFTSSATDGSVVPIPTLVRDVSRTRSDVSKAREFF
jgi:hypothetical protein